MRVRRDLFYEEVLKESRGIQGLLLGSSLQYKKDRGVDGKEDG